MLFITVGKLTGLLNPRRIVMVLLVVLGIVVSLSYQVWNNSSAECVRCHADKDKMDRMQAPWAYTTEEIVQRESRHPHILCRDCHLGDGRARDKDAAHNGMLRMLIISDHGTLLKRTDAYPYGLSKTGEDSLTALLPQTSRSGAALAGGVRNVLWHDRSAETFDFDPGITEKTCGKSGCHPQELKQFKTSVMGKNHRQRTMQTWLKPYGPHNCGPSFADLLPSESHKKTGFDFTNTSAIMKELNVPFTAEQAKDKQKFCNVCHAGCLDCHFSPGLQEKGAGKASAGPHTFSRVPTAESCSGFGRGNTICHPGAMHSRRGETYIGGDYSMPQGMTPDIHYKKGLPCVVCHPAGEGGMGHMDRKASCQDCHLEVEDAVAGDLHRNMDCATCHISELRGYQITVWGPGQVAGRDNPFNKYSLYYGIQAPPVLIKDQKGIWMPVKIWPHSLANVQAEIPRSEGLKFRWPNGETRDAYYVAGTVTLDQNKVPSARLNNKHLLWLEIEQAAHPFGRARSCSSCHDSEKQVAVSRWEFMDDQGAESFSGDHRIEADGKGIRIAGLRASSPIRLLPGRAMTDFAPWLYFKEQWQMPGDFGIRADKQKYRRHLGLSRALQEKLTRLDKRAGVFEKKRLMQYRSLRAFALHNPEEGLKRLAQEFP